MGKLIEQTLSTLFQGVSRQPDTVRLIGQVQEAEDAVFSVVTGGFSDRTGSEHVAILGSLNVTDPIAMYSYERDKTEQFFIFVQNGDLKVFDRSGTERTVDFPNGKAYLASTDPANDFSFATIADSTFISNATKTVLLQGAGSSTVFGPAKQFSDLPREKQVVPKYLKTLDTGSVVDECDDTDTGVANGSIWKIEAPDGDSLGHFSAVLDKTTTSVWSWEETVDPNFDNDFDLTTMPHELVRNANGTFTFKQAAWRSREVGDPDIVPDPDFVGQKINDISFHRNRVGFTSGESHYHGQAGDFFNPWPEKATEVLDSDPFGLTATTSRVNNLAFAVSFRKALFLTSDKQQFEVFTDGLLTPRTASMDQTTSFKASDLTRPITLGDELYFAAESDQDGVVYEYFFDDDSVSNQAIDITKHAEGYVPAPLVRFAGDAVTNTLAVLSKATLDKLYIYRFFWQDDQKVQSAWSRWNFGAGASIIGMDFILDRLYVIVRRGTSVFLERLLPTDEFDDDTSLFQLTTQDGEIRWPIRLDRRVSLTGTFDAPSGLTTWTVPYAHGDDVKGILSSTWTTEDPGRELTLTFPTTTTVTAVGDFSAEPVVFGVPYSLTIEFSRQFLREAPTSTGAATRAITSGRLQLRTMSFDYENTGGFEVHVTPKRRPTRVFKFNARILGSADNVIGATPIAERGTFRVPIRSRGDTVKIEVKNPSHVPCTITSARWTGFFNEITRQE